MKHLIKLIFFVIIFPLLCPLTNAQSKKEQIEYLQNKVDSLKGQIRKTKNKLYLYSIKIDSTKESQNTILLENQQLANDFNSIKKLQNDRTSRNDSKNRNLETLNSNIDSLSNIKKQKIFELEKLKKENEHFLKGYKILPKNKYCSEEYISISGCDGETSIKFMDKTYQIIDIGEQCWFSENLNTSYYTNGDPIDSFNGIYQLSNNANYNGAFELNRIIEFSYGKQYNWYVINDQRGVCPNGWHVSTDCDWMYLENELKMSSQDQESQGWRGGNEGDILKSTTGWEDTNWVHGNPPTKTNSKDAIKFNAKPGGQSGFMGYSGSGENGFWWCAGMDAWDHAWVRQLSSYNSNISRHTESKWVGASIRCVKD
jgi:uncharacterized protein (TIGR02145 family)